MKGRHHLDAVVVEPPPTQLRDRRPLLQERLGREFPERDHDLGANQRELLPKEGLARGDLVGLRVPVPGGTALHDVADVDVLAAQSHSLRDDVRQELTRPTDEGLAAPILLLPRSLADKDESCSRVADAEDEVGSVRRELAALAIANRLAQLLQRAHRRGVLRSLHQGDSCCARCRRRRPAQEPSTDALERRPIFDLRAQRREQLVNAALSTLVLHCRLWLTMLWMVAPIVVAVLGLPGDALAWGPVTHLVHGSQALADATMLAPALQEMLRRHRFAYLYGCIAADIIHAKKYTRSLYTHCHYWPVGWQLLEAAQSEREQAFAWGYLSHLAADVFSHNHYVPVRLVVSFEARTHRHLYWEARFDAAQPRQRWRLLREVLDHAFADCDRLVERVVERTLFSFRTNKRIFNSVMAVQRLEQWHAVVRGLSERSRYVLTASEVESFNRRCIDAIRDLLQRGRDSACQAADPTGQETLARAAALRRKLQLLKRHGGMPEAISAELRALGAAA